MTVIKNEVFFNTRRYLEIEGAACHTPVLYGKAPGSFRRQGKLGGNVSKSLYYGFQGKEQMSQGKWF